ncbi:hypothetical protein HMPREF0322_03855 [Desulfitobacterium hafniense DP7]|uniref:Uncharacterized protein n=1 Tax=Desulfitobacterium hafniense DP7 TaxID=537010 RepID=G9XSA6_DESHA|nr:hypothetical protein [Desulfitobacterium hafniense]EHL05505.1 hypothetical protein HMPREF0322_03855 [Desulfitobacterium hafniense DP7]
MTNLIEDNPDIKKKFPLLKPFLKNQHNEIIVKDAWKSPITVKSIGKYHEPGQIGTAFDYVVRALLAEKIGSVNSEKELIAEKGLKLFPNVIDVPIFPTGDFIIDNERLLGCKKVSKNLKEVLDFLQNRLSKALSHRKKFINKECSLNQVISDSIFLAKLDETFRTKSIHVADYFFQETEGKTYFSQRRTITDQDMVDNISQLAEVFCVFLETVSWRDLSLNPTFGEYSAIVGGADADFIADNCVVDLKTSSKLDYKGDDFAQVLGYAVMARMAGYEIQQVAIYYARYGFYASLDLATLGDDFLDNYWDVLLQKATE